MKAKKIQGLAERLDRLVVEHHGGNNVAAAAAWGISEAAVRNYRNAVNDLKASLVARICEDTGEDPRWLLGLDALPEHHDYTPEQLTAIREMRHRLRELGLQGRVVVEDVVAPTGHLPPKNERRHRNPWAPGTRDPLARIEHAIESEHRPEVLELLAQGAELICLGTTPRPQRGDHAREGPGPGGQDVGAGRRASRTGGG